MYLLAVGRGARGKAAYSVLTHPQTPALAGASVGTRKVLWFWITVGVDLYIIALNKKERKNSSLPFRKTTSDESDYLPK